MSEQEELKPRRPRRSLLRSRVTPLTFLAVIAGIAIFRLWIVETAYVEGHSMQDTLQPGDRVLVLKPVDRNRFDIVVLVDPQEGGIDIKRIVGLPGDVVSMVPHVVDTGGDQQGVYGSQLYVNSQPYDEPYATSVLPKTLAPTKVPPDSYFVLGDNRDDSIDSRRYGPIEGKNVRGVAVAVVYPFGQAKRLKPDGALAGAASASAGVNTKSASPSTIN
jgi:signal peptidase I